MADRFALLMPPLTHLPASVKSSRRSTNGTTELAAKELSPDDPLQPTAAASIFVQVIVMLRKAFIQDSVLMVELHPLWQPSIFSHPV
jgi:hypothetical protein